MKSNKEVSKSRSSAMNKMAVNPDLLVVRGDGKAVGPLKKKEG